MINKLNPLYVIALLVTLVILSQNIKSNAKETFNDNIQLLKKTKVDAKSYSDYKKKWQKSKNNINLILNNPMFKNENIQTKESKNKFEVKYISKNKQKLEKFLNSILNKEIIVENLIIDKNSISITTRL